MSAGERPPLEAPELDELEDGADPAWTKEQEECPLCFRPPAEDRDRELVAAFMCGMSAVLHGTPATMVAQLCTMHQPLVIDAMGFAAENGIPFASKERPPEAHQRDIAAAQAKRDRRRARR